MLTVEQARERRVCRICEQPILVGGPKGWATNFGRMEFPVAVTLNFGGEFAHTPCLAREKETRAEKEVEVMKKGARLIHDIGTRVWVLVQGTSLVSGQPWYDVRERVIAADQGGDCLTVVDEDTGLVCVCPSVDVFLTEQDAAEEAVDRPKRREAQGDR